MLRESGISWQLAPYLATMCCIDSIVTLTLVSPPFHHSFPPLLLLSVPSALLPPSFGVLLLELISGKPAVLKESDLDLAALHTPPLPLLPAGIAAVHQQQARDREDDCGRSRGSLAREERTSLTKWVGERVDLPHSLSVTCCSPPP